MRPPREASPSKLGCWSSAHARRPAPVARVPTRDVAGGWRGGPAQPRRPPPPPPAHISLSSSSHGVRGPGESQLGHTGGVCPRGDRALTRGHGVWRAQGVWGLRSAIDDAGCLGRRPRGIRKARGRCTFGHRCCFTVTASHSRSELRSRAACSRPSDGRSAYSVPLSARQRVVRGNQPKHTIVSSHATANSLLAEYEVDPDRPLNL